MAAALALLSALLYGTADFFGGSAARRAGALRAVTLSVPVGLAVLVVMAVAAGGAPAAPAVAAGTAGGVAGGAGLLTFYRALARGPMSVVAPVSALAAAVLPVLVGVARGERLDPVAIAGVLLCLLAIGLVSMEPAGERAEGGGGPLDSGPLMALVSGACFGVFFVLLKAAGDGAGLWPVVGARAGNLLAVAVALAVAVRLRGGVPGPRFRDLGRPALVLALASGLLDGGANALYFAAAQSGLLSLAAVLTSLYPAITVLLARIAYSERLRAIQRVGLGVAAAGVALVTVG
ncbi:EamA family transporter [Actinomadura parmotrematis]|uniref:DMT family transporter n=1 Tax=Actinomadura parmotrematis TaxID=2864039 RepID=A0ABS7G2Q9_9ACTN|nr:EamA family transporter [Actinomadura parmotrematis]MBW8487010.1 DMT family transporter [Actinomadura parmotrematis]